MAGSYSRGDDLVYASGASPGVYAYIFNPGVEQELFFVTQTPHARIVGTVLEPHVHWTTLDNNSGVVKWACEYTWAGLEAEAFGNTTIITGLGTVDGAGKGASWHYLTSIGPSVHIPGDAKKGPSTMIMGRIARLGDDAEDTYAYPVALLEFDFHYATQALGNDFREVEPWATGISV